MGRILYIFPHPDDESFGPAPAISRQRRHDHEVHLLTLTHGEATSQRRLLGYSEAEMGRVRAAEMQEMSRALDLTSLEILDYPDGGLAQIDPLELERVIRARITALEPDVVVTYTTHGISGHLDHLVTHAAVKYTFCAMRRDGAAFLKRLALFTLNDDDAVERPAHLRGTPLGQIGCVVPVEPQDRARAEEALAAYRTYAAVVQEHRPLDTVANGVCFELFGEEREGRLDDLFAGI